MLKGKILSDLWKNKTQFIIVFLMVFLSIFIFSGIHAYIDGMIYSSSKYYENRNLQDLWIFSEDGFTKEDLVNIKSIKSINDAERVFSVKANVLNSNKFYDHTTGSKIDNMVIELNFIETNRINQIYYVDGAGFDQEKYGLWIDSYLAKNDGIKIGEILKLNIDGYEIEEIVQGFIMVPDHVYLSKDETAKDINHSNYGFAYISINEFPVEYAYSKLNMTKESFDELQKHYKTQELHVFNEMIVDVSDEANIDDVKSEINNKLHKSIKITERDDNVSYKSFITSLEEGKLVFEIISVLLIIVSIVVVKINISKYIENERKQINKLKRAKYKKYRIIWYYVSIVLLVSSFATIIGIILGKEIIGENIFRLKMNSFEIPNSTTIIMPIVYYISIFQILINMFTTYLSCNKELNKKKSK